MSRQTHATADRQRKLLAGAASSKAHNRWPARPADIAPACLVLVSPVPDSRVTGVVLPVPGGPRG